MYEIINKIFEILKNNENQEIELIIKNDIIKFFTFIDPNNFIKTIIPVEINHENIKISSYLNIFNSFVEIIQSSNNLTYSLFKGHKSLLKRNGIQLNWEKFEDTIDNIANNLLIIGNGINNIKTFEQSQQISQDDPLNSLSIVKLNIEQNLQPLKDFYIKVKNEGFEETIEKDKRRFYAHIGINNEDKYKDIIITKEYTAKTKIKLEELNNNILILIENFKKIIEKIEYLLTEKEDMFENIIENLFCNFSEQNDNITDNIRDNIKTIMDYEKKEKLNNLNPKNVQFNGDIILTVNKKFTSSFK